MFRKPTHSPHSLVRHVRDRIAALSEAAAELLDRFLAPDIQPERLPVPVSRPGGDRRPGPRRPG